MNTLEEESGFDPGFINNGGLFIAHNEVIIFIKCGKNKIKKKKCFLEPLE